MGCGASKNLSEPAREFYNELCYQPDLKRRKFLGTGNDKIISAWRNLCYGNSVFLPIAPDQVKMKKIRGSRKTHGKNNRLFERLEKMNTETMNYGGYYVLPNIRVADTEDQFMDIYLLTPKIEDEKLA